MHYAVSQEQERMGDKARERKGKEEGRECSSLWQQVLRAQTLNKQGPVTGLCYRTERTGHSCNSHPRDTSIPISQRRKMGPAAYYPHHVVIK